MAYRIILPKLGTNIEKAKIVSWLKKEGEAVSKGEVLLEVETDKASFEVESEYGGILKKILYTEGCEVPITKTIAIIGDMAENIELLEQQIKQEDKTVVQAYAKQAWKDWFAGKKEINSESSFGEIRMSPAARKLAQEKNIDIRVLARHFQDKKEVLELQDIKDFISSEKIVIYGAGLGAKQALEIIRQLHNIEVVGFIDDNPEIKDRVIYGYRVLGGFDILKDAFTKGDFSSILFSFHSEVRKKIFTELKNRLPQIKIKTLIDPRAVVSQETEMGEGVFIEAGAVIGPGTKIGDAVIVDLGAVVCHDCYIGAYSHLSPGCTLSGIVCLKENVLVGVGSSINSTVTVGKNVIITPSSAVMNDVQDNVIVSGIPAIVIGESKRGR